MVANATRWALAAAFVALPLAAPTTAIADDVTTAEFLELVDAGRVDQLAEVTSIDGAPADMSVVLHGTPQELRARLDSLRQVIIEAADGHPDGARLRAEAEDITSRPPYSAEPAANNDLLARIAAFFAGILSNDAAQGAAVLLVILVATAIAIPLLNRVATRRERRIDMVESQQAEPVDYGSAADEAANRGEFDAAVRLLFLDGAQHLEQNQVVPDAATTSTATIRRITQDHIFLDRFDEIAYGGSAADTDDVTTSRLGWRRVKERWS